VIDAAQILVDILTTPVLHKITVMNMTSGLGASESALLTLTYNELRSGYNPDTNSVTRIVFNSNLPSVEPFQNVSYIITPTQWQAFGNGFIGSENSVIGINFNQSSTYDLIGVSLHEITETMGRIGGFTDQGITYKSLMDLCSFSDVNVRSLPFANGGYFSPDNGMSNYSFFNTNENADASDWSGQTVAHDACNAFGSPFVVQRLSSNDCAVLEALGFFLSDVIYQPPQVQIRTGDSIFIPNNYSSFLNLPFSISPSLPNDLILKDGVIQGNATTIQDSTAYVVGTQSDFITESGSLDLTIVQGPTNTTSSLSSGAIAGIVVGSVALVILVLVSLYFAMKTK
jgi:hypothetical protein